MPCVAFRNVPGGHGVDVGDAVPAPHTYPRGHGAGVVSSPPGALLASQYDPLGHVVQALWPCRSWYSPLPHGVGCALPAGHAYPAGHCAYEGAAVVSFPGQ
jgi:hypothetical protein